MKKLLFILLFFALKAKGQTLTYDSYSQTATPGDVVTIGSVTYTAGNTYLFFIATFRTGATPSDNPTISSGGLALTKIGTLVGDYNNRIIVYSCVVGSNETTAITFTYAESQNTKITVKYVYPTSLSANYELVGANGTTADPSITLTARPNFSAIMVATNNQNPFGGTPESGWTENTDAGSVVPVGAYSMFRNSTSDNTPTITSSASDWTAVSLQIYLTRRRKIID